MTSTFPNTVTCLVDVKFFFLVHHIQEAVLKYKAKTIKRINIRQKKAGDKQEKDIAFPCPLQSFFRNINANNTFYFFRFLVDGVHLAAVCVCQYSRKRKVFWKTKIKKVDCTNSKNICARCVDVYISLCVCKLKALVSRFSISINQNSRKLF